MFFFSIRDDSQQVRLFVRLFTFYFTNQIFLVDFGKTSGLLDLDDTTLGLSLPPPLFPSNKRETSRLFIFIIIVVSAKGFRNRAARPSSGQCHRPTEGLHRLSVPPHPLPQPVFDGLPAASSPHVQHASTPNHCCRVRGITLYVVIL